MADSSDTVDGDESDQLKELRAKAEARLAPDAHEISSLSPDEASTLIHELNTHQIELQMQNEELRRAQAELTESRDRFVDLYDLAPVGYATVNLQGMICELNLTLAEMLGAARSKLVGAPFSRIVLDEDQDALYFLRQKIIKTGKPGNVELRLQTTGCELLWVNLSASLVGEDDDARLRVVFSDITKRKQAEEAVRASEQRFRTITESSGDAIFIANPQGDYVYVNEAASELIGYGVDELTKMNIADISTQGVAAKDLDKFQELMAKGRLFTELNLRKKDGSLVAVDLNAVVLPNGQMHASCRDITARKAMEARLAQADRLASMGTLSAGIAHEINNPLSYILFNLQSLAQDLPGLTRAVTLLANDLGAQRCQQLLGAAAESIGAQRLAELQECTEDAEDGAGRVRDIVKALRTFTRVDEDRMVPVSLNDTIETALNMAANEIKYRATVIKEFAALPDLIANDGKLAQVFLNLLVNAAHAIPEGVVEHNQINVRTWKDGEHLVAEVQDTGCGIPADKLDRIFDPFFTTKAIGEGSGLGLSICHNIIVGLGGTISVDSEPGSGSCFRIRLPAVHQVEAIAAMAVPAPPLTRRGRILIVDDEPLVARVVARMLQDEHETLVVTSGEEAQELLVKDEAFDGILCDLMMPRVTGMDLFAWVLKRNPDLANKMIFISGGVFTPQARDFLARVPNARLEKPFEPQNLRALLRERLQ